MSSGRILYISRFSLYSPTSIGMVFLWTRDCRLHYRHNPKCCSNIRFQDQQNKIDANMVIKFRCKNLIFRQGILKRGVSVEGGKKWQRSFSFMHSILILFVRKCYKDSTFIVKQYNISNQIV